MSASTCISAEQDGQSKTNLCAIVSPIDACYAALVDDGAPNIVWVFKTVRPTPA